MNNKHRKTLEAIFAKPTLSSIKWDNVESLLINLEAEITEGKGSRIQFVLNGVRSTFHKPHPQREIDKGAVMSLRKFLMSAGIDYEKI